MYRLIFITSIIIWFLFAFLLYGQGLTQEEKAKIISDLDSASFFLRYDAIHKIDRFNIVEALPKLEENIWKENCDLRDNYLRLIDKFNSPNTYAIALAFIDSADYVEDCTNFENPLTLKVDAVEILFKFNDYSKSKYVFDLLRKEVDIVALNLLSDIFINVPEYRDSVKHYWFKIVADTSLLDFERYLVLSDIAKNYGTEAIPYAIDIYKNAKDKSDGSRISAFSILCKLNYEELHAFIKENIPIEPASSYRLKLIDTLLTRYGTPADYKFVKDYKEIENNETNIFLIENDYLDDFKPPIDSTILVSTMLDTLISYTNQCYGYDWVRDEAYKDELLDKIETARNYLSSADSVNCAIEMKKFQNSVAQVYADSAGSYPKYISKEGYKFLYYYAGYILDRLPRNNSKKDVNRRR